MNIHRYIVAVALKFTVHGVQSFIKGHRKSGVISIKHSRDMTNRISPLRVECFLPVTATYTNMNTCTHIIPTRTDAVLTYTGLFITSMEPFSMGMSPKGKIRRLA